MSSEVAPKVTPLKRSRLVDDVVDTVRDLILSGELKAGDPLLQNDLSQRLGISRTPLREAFRVLESEGLVRSFNANNTLQVAEYGFAEIRELYQMREVLDGLAARLVAERGLSAADARRLQANIDEMQRSSLPYQPIGHTNAHSAFHRRIVELSGNKRLNEYMATIAMSFQLLSSRLRRAAEGDEAYSDVDLEALFDASTSQHQAILDALIAGDGREAERKARQHIRAALVAPVLASESDSRAS